MDYFEKHIHDHREEFDEFTADRSKMWEEISAELDSKAGKVVPLWKRIPSQIAAGILLILGIGVLIGIYYNKTDDTSLQTSVVSHELREIDQYYGDMVEKQVQMVKHNPRLTEKQKKDFLSFLDDLDAEYTDLKNELGKNLDNERVMEAIITNYKKRIELMENLLNQLKHRKNDENEDGYIL